MGLLVMNGFLKAQAEDNMHRAMKLGAEAQCYWRQINARRAKGKGKERAIDAIENSGEDIYTHINNFIDEYQKTPRFDANLRPTVSASGSICSASPSSAYTNTQPPSSDRRRDLNPIHQPRRPEHATSYADNGPYQRSANHFATSYQNVLCNSGPYQKVDKRRSLSSHEHQQPGLKPRAHVSK